MTTYWRAGSKFSRPVTRKRTPATARTVRQAPLIRRSRARPRRMKEPSQTRRQPATKTGRVTSQMRTERRRSRTVLMGARSGQDVELARENLEAERRPADELAV